MSDRTAIAPQHTKPRAWLLPIRWLYGIYAGVVFLAIALTALLGVLLLPSLKLRRSAARSAARIFLFVAGMPLTVRGTSHIPDAQCVVVANHASYLDGIVFTAALPPRFGFVIKREMDSVPLAGLLLRRIGSEFVERFNRQKGASDARRVLRTAASGHSLVFFPEGTFSHEPGLLKFHTGAFTIAAKASCAVVPSVVRGTREALPSSNVLPIPGAISVEFFAPIVSTSREPDRAAAELRDLSRERILAELGEPDLDPYARSGSQAA
jgi:1-acyl-sn-glycerol-3-phosphate acyltransferase